ncbi:DUF2399 domain-containing protein [Abyssisolibacter fermentans]|uniref:DUF2399 domain-containing protein n=1 Tax=Abyssisolibacter fermentans TaxID=1766203 RepID=UPI000833F869|nr:DUF2399 domain-containing protein [Abyssisolibacter fermentans]
MKLENDCCRYFKQREGFKRVFSEIKRKYISYGCFKGEIKLIKLSKNEIENLTDYLGYNCNVSTFRIKIQEFILRLDETKYIGVNFYEVLCLYFQEKIETKEEQRNREEQIKAKWVKSLEEGIKDFDVKAWIKHNIENKDMLFSKKYAESPKKLYEYLVYMDKTAQLLNTENEYTHIAVLGMKVSNDPHFFDPDKNMVKFLESYIRYKYKISNEDQLSLPEARSELLYNAKIYRDGYLNNITSYGFDGITKKEVIHLGWRNFNECCESINISIKNLENIVRIIPYNKLNSVFIFENPSVFDAVLKHFKKKTENVFEMPSIICTSGQLNITAYKFIEKLKSDKIYYSGDLDPEGLVILSKLIERFGDRIIPLKYTKQDYFNSLSQVILNPTRLKQLDKIESFYEKDLIIAMKNKKKAGYQEKLIDDIIEFISKELSKN